MHKLCVKDLITLWSHFYILSMYLWTHKHTYIHVSCYFKVRNTLYGTRQFSVVCVQSLIDKHPGQSFSGKRFVKNCENCWSIQDFCQSIYLKFSEWEVYISKIINFFELHASYGQLNVNVTFFSKCFNVIIN